MKVLLCRESVSKLGCRVYQLPKIVKADDLYLMGAKWIDEVLFILYMKIC